MNNNRIERAAVRAVEAYIDSCPRLEPVLQSNDKTPIWDGEIYVYGKERHKVDDFSAIVHLQIKGSASAKGNFYRIGRAYVEAYKADRGCVFLLHQQREDSSKLLYAILSVKQIDTLLQQITKTIKIDLKEVPANPLDFEKELIAFAEERNGKRIENTSPKEIESLIKHFNDIKQHLDKVEDNGVKYELESYLNTILGLRNDGTVGWRDKFIYLARKVLDLTLQHVKGYDALSLQFELGNYLHDQKLYHLAEDFYMQALEKCRERAKVLPVYMRDVAGILNNLAVLHRNFNQYAAAEKEYQKALDIQRKLAEDNPDAYLGDVAMTLINLGNLHKGLNHYDAAGEKYQEALNIYKKLAKDNPDVYLGDVASTLNNLGNLHSNLNQYDAAEKEYQEALNIRRKLAKDKTNTFWADAATTLNNIGLLHYNLNQYAAAENEYQEALEIRRKLAKDNPDAFMAYVASTLNNLAALHYNLKQYAAAENEYQEALEIRRKLAKDYPDAYLGDVAMTLNNIATLNKDLNKYVVAENEFKEALEIRRKLAEDNPDAFLAYVASTLNNLGNLHRELIQYTLAESEYQEALEIYRGLAKLNPDAFLSYVATTLNNLGLLHSHLNLFAAAENEYHEALDIRRKLAKDYPDAYLGDVAMTLFNQALLMMQDEQRINEAKQAAQESLDLFKTMAQKAPERWNQDVDKAQQLLDFINLVERRL